MQLWTFHGSGFSLNSGAIDVRRSPYFVTYPNIRAAYEELGRRLGLNSYEIIWCHVRRDWNPLGYADCNEYELEVPPDKFLSIVDAFTWNKILGIKDAFPRSLYHKWRNEAPPERFGDYIDQKRKEYNEQAPPAGGWWSQLFIADLNAEGATVLLKHPIPEAWIIHGPNQ